MLNFTPSHFYEKDSWEMKKEAVTQSRLAHTWTSLTCVVPHLTGRACLLSGFFPLPYKNRAAAAMAGKFLEDIFQRMIVAQMHVLGHSVYWTPDHLCEPCLAREKQKGLTPCSAFSRDLCWKPPGRGASEPQDRLAWRFKDYRSKTISDSFFWSLWTEYLNL